MTTFIRPLALSLLLAIPLASAASPSFYFIDIGIKGNATLYSGAKTAAKGDLSYALVDHVSSGCCFRAAARKPAGIADDDAHKFIADGGNPIFSHAVQFSGARKPELDQAYGFEGMQAVTKKGRGTYQVTMQTGDPVFVRACFSGEGMRVRLYHRLGDRKPYASYYHYLGYDVEPICR